EALVSERAASATHETLAARSRPPCTAWAASASKPTSASRAGASSVRSGSSSATAAGYLWRSDSSPATPPSVRRLDGVLRAPVFDEAAAPVGLGGLLLAPVGIGQDGLGLRFGILDGAALLDVEGRGPTGD